MYAARRSPLNYSPNLYVLKRKIFKRKNLRKNKISIVYLIIKTSHAMTSATLNKHVRYELAKGRLKSDYNLSHGLTRKKRRR